MTTEFILLLVVTVVMLMTPVYKGVRGVFEYGGPSIAIRMEGSIPHGETQLSLIRKTFLCGEHELCV